MNLVIYFIMIVSKIVSASSEDTVFNLVSIKKSSDGFGISHLIANCSWTNCSSLKRNKNWYVIQLNKQYSVEWVKIVSEIKSQGITSNTFDHIYVSSTFNKEYVKNYSLCRKVNIKNLENLNIIIRCRPNTPPGQFVIVEHSTYLVSFLSFEISGKEIVETEYCNKGYYGELCDKQCNCKDETPCIKATGKCPLGCLPNWEGETCNTIKIDLNSQRMGCFYENSFDKDIEDEISNTENCLSTCGQYGYNYVSYQNSSCFCSDSITFNCTESNVYLTCPKGSYGYNCTLRCNCMNSSKCLYMNGTCIQGCSSEWMGERCDIRNCSVNNGGCPKDEVCNFLNSVTSECNCPSGYIRSQDHHKCIMSNNTIFGIFLGILLIICIVAVIITAAIVFKKRKDYIKYGLAKRIGKFKEIVKDSVDEQCEIVEPEFALRKIPDYVKANSINFPKDYESIPQIASSEITYANQKELKSKNRYKSILPYDFNRVILEEIEGKKFSDYINASRISNVFNTKCIATQGPLSKTVYDFWRMVWQEEIEIVVMLCNVRENEKNKCEQYWPLSDSMTIKEFTISVDSITSWPEYVCTVLTVKKGMKLSKQVVHLHFISWPDHGVPEIIPYFLSFCDLFLKVLKTKKCPVIVHCSAGVGRTGCFIALCDLLQRGRDGLNVEVYECVKRLREDRMKLVEKFVIIGSLLMHGSYDMWEFDK